MQDCPRCGFEPGSDLTECPACGIVFERYEAAQRAAEERAAAAAFAEPEPLDLTEAIDLLGIPRPLRFLATLNVIGGAISLLIALALLVFALDSPALVVQALINGSIGVLYIWIGHAIRRRSPAVRYFLLVGAFAGLVAIPLGTVMSLLLLSYLFHPGMRILYSDKEPEDLTDEDLDHLRAFHVAPSGLWFVRVTVGSMVLAVVGIVLALGLGGVGAFRAFQDRVQAENDMQAIEVTVRDYATGAQFYPRSQIAPHLARAIHADIPTIDPWGNPYVYQRHEAKAFRVGSAGPDGEWTHGRLSDYREGSAIGDDLVLERGKVLE